MTILIIGGAAQGKSAFARTLSPEQDIIDDLHVRVQRALRDNTALPQAAISRQNRGLPRSRPAVSSRMDAQERAWRECTGRLCCDIAAQADRVYRVYCGIATCIKGAS